MCEMRLPLDLFQFLAIDVYSDKDAEFLVGLIHNLANKEGLYFGEHYMSDQICFEKIYVKPEYIPTLHPHIESLSSIKVFSFEGHDLILHNSFLDLIVLYDIFECEDRLKACFFKDSELKEINPIYESFKRNHHVGCINYENALEKLNILNQISIQEIEEVRFGEMDEENFEQITYQLLNYKIHTLAYFDFSCESISNQALENISKINPRELYLASLSSISSVFKIFLHLRQDIKVSFGFAKIYDSYPLKFEKTVVIFKNKDGMIKAFCDKIGCSFKEDLIQENILFLENYICISNFEKIHVENVTTKTPLEDLSLDDLKNESCILIPRNNLSCIKLKLGNMSYIFENEINVTNFKSLSSKTKIIIELFSMEDLAELNKLNKNFPEHSELTIDYSYSCINNTNFDETLLLDILSKFKLTSLVVRNGNWDKDVLMQLLQMPSIQKTLEHFKIYRLDIFEYTSFVELIVEFKRVKTIEINCLFSLNTDDNILECIEKIKEIKDKMKKKHSEIKIDIDYRQKTY